MSLYALIGAVIALLPLAVVHVRYSFNGTYERWAQEAVARVDKPDSHGKIKGEGQHRAAPEGKEPRAWRDSEQ